MTTVKLAAKLSVVKAQAKRRRIATYTLSMAPIVPLRMIHMDHLYQAHENNLR